MTPNPTIVKCSACGAECKQRTYGWWRAGGFLAWAVFVFTGLAWTSRLSTIAGILVAIPFCVLFAIAERRLYHAWFAWRHPTRCHGGGLPEPEKAR